MISVALALLIARSSLLAASAQENALEQLKAEGELPAEIAPATGTAAVVLPYIPRDDSPGEKERAQVRADDIRMLSAKAFDLSIPAPVMPVQATFGTFSLSPGRTCATPWAPPQFCQIAGPKEWTPQEIDLFSPVFSGLVNDPRLTAFFQKVNRNGYTTIFRYTQRAEFDVDSGQWQAKMNSAWYDSFDKSINMTDRLFMSKRTHIRTTGMTHDMADLGLLHELAHIFDGDEQDLPDTSILPEFLQLTGFNLGSDGEWSLVGVDAKELGEMKDWYYSQFTIAATMPEGPERAAFVTSINERVNGYAQKLGFPSLYSMLGGPSEAFAEFVAYTFYEPELMRLTNPNVSAWIEKSVFK